MIIKKIKNKKPLNRLDDEFIRYYLDEFFKRNSKLKKKFDENKLRKKDEVLIVKNVRNELNKIYGQFWLENGHRSLNERDFSKELYKEIIIGKPKTILDLGAGLNPLTYSYIPGFRDIYFTAVELTKYDCNNLKKIFEKKNINGIVIQADLREYNKFPRSDICFMFKILDFFDHKISEELIKSVKSELIVVSFSTKTIKGKNMSYPRRGWFEVMIKRLGFEFKKLYFNNEVFYLFKK